MNVEDQIGEYCVQCISSVAQILCENIGQSGEPDSGSAIIRSNFDERFATGGKFSRRRGNAGARGRIGRI